MKDSAPSRRSIMLGSIGVFAIAIILRVPSCYESLWLDELHSAWCVWGSLGEVFPRAQIGNQSPLYFIGLWFWGQIVGDSEIGLRLSSVLALAASSVVLTVGVARWTKSFAAGVTAGLVIAVESNAIFFGTELRPYAFVILFASIALACFLQLAATESRHQHSRYWSAMIIAFLLAALSQPTSIGVLACLPLILCCVWLLRDSRQLLKVTLLDILLGMMVAAVGFALWRITLGETWRQRTNWATFAEATRVRQIGEVWDWMWLLVIPLSVVLVSAVIATLRKTFSSNREVFGTTLLLGLIAVLATSLYWGVSRANLAPVWHRRYFIAVLPILACVVGGSVGVLESVLRPLRATSAIALVTATVLAIGLAHKQGTLQQLPNYPVALAIRGEDWRAANAWVRSNAEATDLIFLDAGLVEAHAWLDSGSGLVKHGDNITVMSPPAREPTSQQLDYLVFAVNGPYDIGASVLPTTLGSRLRPYELPSDWSSVPQKNNAANRVIVITRRPANRVNPSFRSAGSKVLGFGNVSVIVRPSNLGRRL
jgi:hypothetical protein